MTAARWVALLVAVAGLFACEEPPQPVGPRPLRSMRVGDVAGFEASPLSGRAKATQELDLAFENAGQLVERPVNVGDAVPAGTLLARIDPRSFENAVARAKAERDRARAFRDRIVAAARTGAVSRQEVTDAKARFNQADAQVQIREKDLEDTAIIAPFDGTVSDTFVDNFQNVRAKQPVIRFLDVSQIEMVVDVPESQIALTEYVKAIRIRFDALGGVEVPARVKEVSNEATRATRTYPVTLVLDPPPGVVIRPGMAGSAMAEIDLPTDVSAEGIEVPASALFADDARSDQQSFVWVVDEANLEVHRREVETLRLSPTGVIVRGIEPGERIATAGVHYLQEGQKVRLLEP